MCESCEESCKVILQEICRSQFQNIIYLLCKKKEILYYKNLHVIIQSRCILIYCYKAQKNLQNFFSLSFYKDRLTAANKISILQFNALCISIRNENAHVSICFRAASLGLLPISGKLSHLYLFLH